MRPQALPLFDPPPKFKRRNIPGFDYGDKVRWTKPKAPSRALSGKVLGFTQHCTRILIRTSDTHLITLSPDEVINTTRSKES
jgi:hypothetical protein